MAQEELNKIAKGAFIVFLGMIISKFFTYFYRLIIARYLGPEDYGLVSLGLAILGIASTLALLGLPQGVTRYIAYYNKKDKYKQILKNSLVITIPASLIIATLLFIFSSDISTGIFHNQRLSIVIKLFSILLPFIAISNNLESVLKALKKVKEVIFVRNISESAIQLLATATLIFLGFEILGAIFGYIIAIISSTIIFIIILTRKKLFYKEVKKQKDEYKELLSFSWPLLFVGLFTSVSGWIDSLLIGYFLDVSSTGIYNAALPTASLLLIVPSALTIIFMPIITELYSKKKSAQIEVVHKNVAKWILLLVLPLFAIIVIFSQGILNMLFGSYYTDGYVVLIILSIGFLSRSISTVSIYLLQMLKKTKTILVNSIMTLILSIILNIILIPKLKIVGAALAITISTLFSSVFLILISYKFTGLIPFSKKQLKFIISALISALLIIPLSNIFKSVLQTLSLILLFLVLYIILLAITKSFDENDKEMITSIKKKISKTVRNTK